MKNDLCRNNLVTGGAGFIGSNLIYKLLELKENVTCIDDLSTGVSENIDRWKGNKQFTFYNHDVTKKLNIDERIDRIWHLACPASPYYYLKDPVRTACISFIGTYNFLELARSKNAQFLLASTSEIYGNQNIYPQMENNNGSVDILNSRACYSEGKRLAETVTYEYSRKYNLDIKVARIFNTYGPNLRIDDMRVISNFIVNSLLNKPLIIYGNGNQTRSFCYISDLINGLLIYMNSKYKGPINIGKDKEISIKELALLVKTKTNSSSQLKYMPLPENEPFRRIPSIKLARNKLNWHPSVDLNEGLDLTIDYFRTKINL